MKGLPQSVLRWANKGNASSSFRPARVDTVIGSPKDYRFVMTDISDMSNAKM